MERLDVDRRRQPVRQVDVKALGRAAPQPLAVADHDVERRLLLPELLEHLVLKAGPGNLVHDDIRVLLSAESAARLKAVGRRPLRPPDGERPLGSRDGGGRRGLGGRLGRLLVLAAGRDGDCPGDARKNRHKQPVQLICPLLSAEGV